LRCPKCKSEEGPFVETYTAEVSRIIGIAFSDQIDENSIRNRKIRHANEACEYEGPAEEFGEE